MRLAYRRRVEGISTWGIIHNIQYFLVNIPIFEDGSADCWELHDLNGIKEKIKSGWLVTQVPEGKQLDIFGLGLINIQNADFVFDNESYYKYLYETVKKMNSKMEGLYVKTKDIQDNLKRRKVCYTAHEYPIKQEPWLEYEGLTTSVFQKLTMDSYRVINVACYKDHTFMLSSNEGTYLSYDQLSDLFEKGELTAEINKPAWFVLGDMGKIYGSLIYQVENKNKMAELLELEKKACKEETLHDRCRKLYFEYLVYPNESNRQALKEVYEQLPEHERQYLGDMDSKDSDYYRIIYHPEVKREV